MNFLYTLNITWDSNNNGKQQQRSVKFIRINVNVIIHY